MPPPRIIPCFITKVYHACPHIVAVRSRYEHLPHLDDYILNSGDIYRNCDAKITIKAGKRLLLAAGSGRVRLGSPLRHPHSGRARRLRSARGQITVVVVVNSLHSPIRRLHLVQATRQEARRMQMAVVVAARSLRSPVVSHLSSRCLSVARHYRQI